MMCITTALATLLILLALTCVLQRKPGMKLPPGPRPLPIIGNLHLLGSLPHRALAKLARKYGPIMSLRLGQVPTIVVSSPQAAQLFLKQHDAIFASRPLVQTSLHLSYGTKGLVFSPYGDYWRHMRKIVTLHLLTAAKIQGFEELRRTETEVAMRRLKVAATLDEVVDVGERVGELIEEITFKMVVGKGPKEDKRFNLKAVMEDVMDLVGAFNLGDFVPWIAPFDLQGLKRKSKATSNTLNGIFESIIEDHLKEDSIIGQQKDILSTMLSLLNDHNKDYIPGFDRDNIKAIMLDLFAAGIDTSSVTIAWALATLLKYPRAMRLLQGELDDIIGRDRMVKESDLPKLRYLDMVVKETLRLYPVGPLLVPHESMDNVSVNGYMIPKGARIIVNFWTIGRDTTIWSENAEDFYPERFSHKDIDVRGNNFEFIPFGSGRRGCPGMQLGLITTKLIIAQLVHCFDWKLPNAMQPEEVDMTEKFGTTMPRANKLLAIPSYRLQVA